MKKRLCLFAGFDKTAQIQDYVVYYIKSLAQFCDVYYYADCDIAEEELLKLSPYVKKSFAIRHAKYDFGSWQNLIQYLGWDFINTYDELILANDSCYGPLFSWETVFDKMDIDPCDFWGLTSSRQINWHLQSYFLVFRQSVLSNRAFQYFWESVKVQPNVAEVIMAYELTLTPLLLKEKFKASAYLPCEKKTTSIKNITSFPFSLIKQFQFPLLKVKTFTEPLNHLEEICDNWDAFLRRHSSFPTQLIDQHLKNMDIEIHSIMEDAFLSCCKRTVFFKWNWVFLIKITARYKLLIKLFKIPVVSLPLNKQQIIKALAFMGITRNTFLVK